MDSLLEELRCENNQLANEHRIAVLRVEGARWRWQIAQKNNEAAQLNAKAAQLNAETAVDTYAIARETERYNALQALEVAKTNYETARIRNAKKMINLRL